MTVLYSQIVSDWRSGSEISSVYDSAFGSGSLIETEFGSAIESASDLMTVTATDLATVFVSL